MKGSKQISSQIVAKTLYEVPVLMLGCFSLKSLKVLPVEYW